MIAMHFTGNSLGIMIGCLFKDAQRTSAMAPAILLPLMMFSGLYSRLNTISIWVRWIQYISPFRYGLQALLYNEFKGVAYLATRGNVTQPLFIEEELNISMTSGENLAVLLAIAILFYTLGFIFLKVFVSKLAA
jgi:ATP-binding cassette subfamily G (WHITE) protein 2